MQDSEFVVVLVTAGDAQEAERLADALVEERLAGCVNLIGPIRSVYRWEGKVRQNPEHLLVIKTRRALFEAVSVRVHELHSYNTPEVIALPVEVGAPNYLAWLAETTALA